MYQKSSVEIGVTDEILSGSHNSCKLVQAILDDELLLGSTKRSIESLQHNTSSKIIKVVEPAKADCQIPFPHVLQENVQEVGQFGSLEEFLCE